ncbi:hypothetical protein HanRHA438_Chr04g0164501 [Helianthus annuus]|nr:hypothetical protein HanRHA438_Chr04g0164501 [Helianthus annuus]
MLEVKICLKGVEELKKLVAVIFMATFWHIWKAQRNLKVGTSRR